MKTTQNNGFGKRSSLKTGLSVPLALLLALSVFQPMQAKAGTHEAVAALFELAPTETTENLEAESTSTVQDILLRVCLERGYDQECAKHLLGMMWKESNNVSKAVGDHGRARGYFQIWVKLHKISVECAEDLACSAQWTLSYLERNGYERYPIYAIQCHNGCNIENGYAASVLRHGKRLWNSPLEVEKTSEVAMAR